MHDVYQRGGLHARPNMQRRLLGSARGYLDDAERQLTSARSDYVDYSDLPPPPWDDGTGDDVPGGLEAPAPSFSLTWEDLGDELDAELLAAPAPSSSAMWEDLGVVPFDWDELDTVEAGVELFGKQHVVDELFGSDSDDESTASELSAVVSTGV